MTLPLEGYYRPGRYMPVRVEVRGAAEGAILRLDGEGMVPTELMTLGGRLDCVVPLLPMENGASALRWSLGEEGGLVDAALRAIEPGEQLVGFTAAVDPEVAAALFPQARNISIRIEVSDLTQAHASAWQALDALVADAGVLTPWHVKALVSGGVAIALRSEAPPTGENWIWERVGKTWVVRHEALGPQQQAGVFAAAFAPVQGRKAELPESFRRMLLQIGVLVAILLGAAAIVRGRKGIVLVVVVALLATFLLRHRWKATSPLLTRRGDVEMTDGTVFQGDRWMYYAAVKTVSGWDVWSGVTTTPFFERNGDWRAIDLRLVCDERGEPNVFRFRLSPSQQVAFMKRGVAPVAAVTRLTPSPGESPMTRLARNAYLRPGYEIVGVLPAPGKSPRELLTEHYRGAVIVRQRTAGEGVSQGGGAR